MLKSLQLEIVHNALISINNCMNTHAIYAKINSIEIFESLLNSDNCAFSESTLCCIADSIVNFSNNCKKLIFTELDSNLLAENTTNLIPTYVSKEFESTIAKYKNIRQVLNSKVLKFIEHKTKVPYNGNIPGSETGGFGSSDKRFKPNGTFNRPEIRNIAHAHLTPDISIVYRIHDGRLDIFGLYSHDAIGTGQPANINRQEQAAKRWSSETLDTPLDAEALDSEPELEPAVSKVKKQPKVQNLPKAKPVQQVSSKMDLAKKVDALWPQRQLYAKLTAPGVDVSRALENEARALVSLFRGVNPARIPTNQREYFEKFQDLYSKFA